MTPSAKDLADSLVRLADRAAACPPGALSVHEEAVAKSALLTLAGLVGSLEWRLHEEAHARELELERAQAATAPPGEVVVEGR